MNGEMGRYIHSLIDQHGYVAQLEWDICGHGGADKQNLEFHVRLDRVHCRFQGPSHVLIP